MKHVFDTCTVPLNFSPARNIIVKALVSFNLAYGTLKIIIMEKCKGIENGIGKYN
jgi:hypothetical protein